MIHAQDDITTPTGKSNSRGRSGASKPRKSRRAGLKQKSKLTIDQVFSQANQNPFDQIQWDKRVAEITDGKGKIIFRQEGVEVPKSWSMLATNVVVSKYFYGEQGTSEREYSVRQLIHRVCRTIADWGIKDGYFSKEDGEIFYNELAWLCVNQYGAFNSPVWFNVGLFHEYGVGKDSAKGNWYFDTQEQNLNGLLPNMSILSVVPASSNRLRITWKISCVWPTAKRCSSSMDLVPAQTSHRSDPARRNSVGVADPAAPCPSSRFMTKSPMW